MTDQELTRRQRQIMDALIELGQATVAQIIERIADPPSYNTARKILSILEDRGQVSHASIGRQFVYKPKRSPEKLGSQALHKVLRTFFGGSIERAISTYFSDPNTSLTDEQIAELQSLIKNAKKTKKRGS